MSGSRSRPDYYSRRAKAEGYAARSVYKLEEMDQRWNLLRTGNWVLDLGCSPGSWTAYAAKRVGPTGNVLGLDLKPVNVTLPPHAETQVGDIYTWLDDAPDPGRYNVVLSDMAPATTGHRDADKTRSAALAEQALALAERVLWPRGHFVVKLLEGRDIDSIVKQMRTVFEKVERLRPKATRSQSTEIFLVGLSRKEKDETP